MNLYVHLQYLLIETPEQLSLIKDGEVIENFALDDGLLELVRHLKPGDTLTYGTEGA